MSKAAFDWTDALFLLGVLLVGVALYLLAGWPAVLGYAGAIAMMLAAWAGRK